MPGSSGVAPGDHVIAMVPLPGWPPERHVVGAVVERVSGRVVALRLKPESARGLSNLLFTDVSSVL